MQLSMWEKVLKRKISFKNIFSTVEESMYIASWKFLDYIGMFSLNLHIPLPDTWLRRELWVFSIPGKSNWQAFDFCCKKTKLNELFRNTWMLLKCQSVEKEHILQNVHCVYFNSMHTFCMTLINPWFRS